jgi:putative alpha-1,2-mannosidase
MIVSICRKIKPVIIAGFFMAAPSLALTQPLIKFVDPFIGTGGHGHTYPGATVPFGMVQLSPDNGSQGWDWCSGYHYSDSVIAGFSHTHLSGTGIGDWCDISVMPSNGMIDDTTRLYRQGFSHANEKASPGYYEVLLSDGIKASFTTTERVGFHQYEFPKGLTASHSI